MCGRFTFLKNQESVQNKYSIVRVTKEVEFLMNQPRYNIAPSQEVAVIVKGDPSVTGEREARAMRWGLIPHWAKDSMVKVNTINARAERVAESPVYRTAFERTRCIVPASGYYEWKSGSSPKQPYYIHPEDRNDLLAFAGLWDRWVSPEGEAVDSFTIMTTAANHEIETVHHRMPVILSDEMIQPWLGETTASVEQLSQIMKPRENTGLQFYPVSTAVNKVANDSDLNLLPYEPLEFDF